MGLGQPGYDELWAFADLRGGDEYLSARYREGDWEEAWVHGLAVAHQRQRDGTTGGFLLVELDANGEVIDDWVETDLEGAKQHGASLAEAESSRLTWEPVPDTNDVQAYIRK